MADQTFMFMATAGTMAALTALLFVSKGLRMKSGAITATSSSSSPSASTASPSSSSDKSYDKGGKKVKKYSPDGKPIYEN